MNKKLSLIALLMTAALLLTACGASKADSAYWAESNSASMDYAASTGTIASESAPAAPGTMSSEELQTSSRKLIKNVTMSVETLEFDAFMANIESRLSELNGYVESKEVSNGRHYNYYYDRNFTYNRNATLVLRIPVDNLSLLVEKIEQGSNIISQSESIQDVTLQYVDLDSHRQTLEAEQERLLQFMDRAETIEELMSVEERLTEVRYQLESIVSQLKVLENQVSYSTVRLYVDEVEHITQVAKETIGERISSGLSNTFYDISVGSQDFLVWFVVNLPHLLIWGVIIFVIVFIIVKIRRKRKAKKALRKAAGAGTETAVAASVEKIEDSGKNDAK